MTIFNFPNGIDSFTPVLINNLTIVNADHVNDLRTAIYDIENALAGITNLPYGATSIVQSTDNLIHAIALLDMSLSAALNQIGIPPVASAPAGTPAFGSARNYAILAGSAVTNTGSSVLTGNLGVSPGTSITGFPPGTFSGTEDIANANSATAQNDALTAYTDLSTRSAGTTVSALDGLTLTPGTYTSGSTMSLAASGPGILTFNGLGVYVIQIGSALTTGAGGTPTMLLINGARPEDIYWTVGSSATINVGSPGTFQGNIIAQASITVTDGGTVNGTLAALTGAVTLSAATNINVQTSIETVVDGYFSRIDSLEQQLAAHRSSPGPVDSEGYGVHGVQGNVVGTNNVQTLLNKKLDTGAGFIGPKVIVRAHLGDSGLHQVELYNQSNQLAFWLDDQGNAFFKGSITVSGDEQILNTEIIKSNLVVDGYSVLGDSSLSWTTTVNGDLTVNNTNTTFNSVNINALSATSVNLGVGSGTANLNFTQTNVSGNLTVGSLLVSGTANFGTQPIITAGNLTVGGDLNASGTSSLLGSVFLGNNTATDDLTINVNNVNITAASGLAIHANIDADGTQYTFGAIATAATNSFVVYGNSQLNGDVSVTGNTALSGSLTIQTAPPVTSSSTGTAGQITYDANWLYVCIATNTWKRTAIATF